MFVWSIGGSLIRAEDNRDGYVVIQRRMTVGRIQERILLQYPINWCNLYVRVFFLLGELSVNVCCNRIVSESPWAASNFVIQESLIGCQTSNQAGELGLKPAE